MPPDEAGTHLPRSNMTGEILEIHEIQTYLECLNEVGTYLVCSNETEAHLVSYDGSDTHSTFKRD